MPSSALSMVEPVLSLVLSAQLGPGPRILDVGPGHGKYGLLVREYRPDVGQLYGVEGEKRYRARFPWLDAIYDAIAWGDVMEFVRAELVADDWLLDSFDLVLMADVLEHLDHADGEQLLAAIPGTVVVNTPRDYFQNPEAYQGWPTESHRSVWTLDELEAIRPLDYRGDSWVDSHGAILARMAPL